MNRIQLEHIIRAASQIADDPEIVVIGSQAIHAQEMKLPPIAFQSVEADVYPRNHPDRADEIDAAIGELSPFHQTHGYYAHGISPRTAILPEGWDQRLIRLSNPNTGGATGLCLDVHDLVLSNTRQVASGTARSIKPWSSMAASARGSFSRWRGTTRHDSRRCDRNRRPAAHRRMPWFPWPRRGPFSLRKIARVVDLDEARTSQGQRCRATTTRTGTREISTMRSIFLITVAAALMATSPAWVRCHALPGDQFHLAAGDGTMARTKPAAGHVIMGPVAKGEGWM